MAVCYFMGVKKITSKKSGKDFFPAVFLHVNSFNSWETITKFCDSPDVFAVISETLIPGVACICVLGMNGELLSCKENPDIPALDLPDISGSL